MTEPGSGGVERGRSRAPDAGDAAWPPPLKGNVALRAVVFDLDGVLVNTEDLYSEACETVLGRRGKTYDHDLRERMMGRPVGDAIQIMIDAHKLPDRIDHLMEECRKVLEVLMATSLAPMPGVVSLLDWLAAEELPAAVATSALRRVRRLRANALGSQAAVSVCADIGRCPLWETRPGNLPAIGRAAETRAGADDGAGGQRNGYRAAVAAGAFTVAVPNRHTCKHDFSGAQFMAETLADRRITEVLAEGARGEERGARGGS